MANFMTQIPISGVTAMAANCNLTVIAIAPTCGKIYVSTNRGKDWDQTSSPYYCGGPEGYEKDWMEVVANCEGDKIYALSDYGGLSLSNDFGFGWKTFAFPYLRMESFITHKLCETTLHPVVHAVDGVVKCSHDGQRMVKLCRGHRVDLSNNYGAYWHQIFSTEYPCKHVAMDEEAKHITITCSNGIFTTSNSGDTWLKAILPPDLSWQGLACDPTGQYLLVATGDGTVTDSDGKIVRYTQGAGQLYISSDGGRSWAVADTLDGLGPKQWLSVAMSVSRTDLQVIAVAEDGQAYIGPFSKLRVAT